MDFTFILVTLILIIFLFISYLLKVIKLSTPLFLIYLIFCFTYLIDINANEDIKIRSNDMSIMQGEGISDIRNNTKIKTAYNLGVGKGVSVQQVIDSFEKVNNLKISYELGPRRSGDVEQIYSDNNKINNELGWFPVMTFESALESAWNWEKLKNL